MNRLVELAGSKPSGVVAAMVRGLKSSEHWKDFEVDMSTFGTNIRGYCFGCAATCAILELAGTHLNLRSYKIRENIVLIEEKDIWRFEHVIDCLRLGSVLKLFDRFFSDYDAVLPDQKLPYLTTENWRENLGPYELYVKQLQSMGL